MPAACAWRNPRKVQSIDDLCDKRSRALAEESGIAVSELAQWYAQFINHPLLLFNLRAIQESSGITELPPLYFECVAAAIISYESLKGPIAFQFSASSEALRSRIFCGIRHSGGQPYAVFDSSQEEERELRESAETYSSYARGIRAKLRS